MKVLKTIGFIFLMLLIWVSCLLIICLIISDVDKLASIFILCFIIGIVAMVFATKWFIKNGYRINHHNTHLSKYGEVEAKLSDATILAEKINNSSVDINAFCSDYHELCECMDRLILLNEKKHVSMDPTPRANKERIANNLPATINDFIDRSILEINSTSGYAAVINWLNTLRHNEEFKALSSEAVEAHINSLLYGDFEEYISKLDKPNTLTSMSAYDELLPQAVDVIFDTKQASVSMLQRRLKLGYSRAACIVDQMEELGIIGPMVGSKPRPILISEEQWEGMKHNFVTEYDWQKAQFGASSVDYELYRIDHMEGHDFEYWCADILRKSSFINVEVTQASNDQGVDVLAEKDGIKYAIQCKCYSSDLGNKPIQEVNTGKAIYHCHVGAVMTNRYFTTGAKEAAAANSILLWDRDYITELLENLN